MRLPKKKIKKNAKLICGEPIYLTLKIKIAGPGSRQGTFLNKVTMFLYPIKTAAMPGPGITREMRRASYKR